MHSNFFIRSFLGGLLFFWAGTAGAQSLGWSFTNWTGDSDSGITNKLPYTAAHCFGDNHASVVVNLVPFTGGFTSSGTGWSLGGGIANWNGDDNAAVTGSSEDLAEEFVYNGNPRTVQLSGLTVGLRYRTTFYSVGFDTPAPFPGARWQNFAASGGTSSNIQPNVYGNNQGIRISYVFDATNTTQDFAITPSGAGGTFHMYALANRQEPPPFWSILGVSNLTATSATAYATLQTSNAVVTLYWEEGITNVPFDLFGWDGTNGPGVESTGLVSRGMSGLAADTRYTVVYHATNNLLSNGWSAACTFSTDLTAAQKPVFTSAVVLGSTISLGWQDNASNETGYILQRSDGGPYTAVATLPAGATSFLDFAFPASGTYFYRLAATNAGNGSVTDFADCETNATVMVEITYHPISGDADSEISSNKTYTHAIDFGNSPVATVNGVVFGNGSAGAGGFPGPTGSQTVGTGFSNLPNNHGGGFEGNIPFAGQAINDLLRDMIYNAAQGVITLTGLTPGRPYRFRLYNRQWTSFNRGQEVGFETDGVGTDITQAEASTIFNQDRANEPAPGFPTETQVYAMTYDYTLSPGVSNLTLYMNLTGNGSYHLYGLTNEEREQGLSIAKSVAETMIVLGAGGSNLTYTIDIQNPHTQFVCGVVVTDTMPARVDYLFAVPPAGQTNGDNYIFNLGCLAPGANTSIVINAAYTSSIAGVALTNWAFLGTTDAVFYVADNFDSAVTTVSALNCSIDTDGDGMSDCEETCAGTDPMDANSFLWIQITRTGTADVHRLTFPTSTGRTYKLESSMNLHSNAWNVVLSNLPGIGTNRNLMYTNPAERVYYRIGVVSP